MDEAGMRERVARAIAGTVRRHGTPEDAADAVLEAMMEPPPEMVEAFYAALWIYFPEDGKREDWLRVAKEALGAMITAARSGSSGER